MKIPKILQSISDKLNTLDAKAIIVGGSVRDHFLGLEIKDYDIEVYGLKSVDELEKVLKEYGKVKLVGKSFGVLKFVYDGFEYDFAFPRREVKSGAGHKGFDVVSDGFMSYKEAAKRRDFTINAMGYDIQKDQFLDPFGGMDDIKNRVLRHIDDKTFVEDPLRLYRGIQFCARFEYKMDDKTKELCKIMTREGELDELPKERVFEEFKKLLLKAKKPSIGFKLLKEFNTLDYFPELFFIDWDTTMRDLDRLTYRDLRLKLAILTLSLDKKSIESFLHRLSDEVKLIEDVISLTEGCKFVQNSSNLTDTDIRRLSTMVTIETLSKICENKTILEDAKRLGVLTQAPKQLLQGRDLIALGYKPSEEFSKILDRVYQLQISGEIRDKEEALEFVKKCKSENHTYK
jgi:tRNA nucleotidyltransferase (CCA-adding enzyme)